MWKIEDMKHARTMHRPLHSSCIIMAYANSHKQRKVSNNRTPRAALHNPCGAALFSPTRIVSIYTVRASCCSILILLLGWPILSFCIKPQLKNETLSQANTNKSFSLFLVLFYLIWGFPHKHISFDVYSIKKVIRIFSLQALHWLRLFALHILLSKLLNVFICLYFCYLILSFITLIVTIFIMC